MVFDLQASGMQHPSTQAQSLASDLEQTALRIKQSYSLNHASLLYLLFKSTFSAQSCANVSPAVTGSQLTLPVWEVTHYHIARAIRPGCHLDRLTAAVAVVT